jgi:hypothetical protein
MPGDEVEEEVSLKTAIGKLLVHNGGYWMWRELVPTDGQRIPEHRKIIAARGKVPGTLW